MTHRDLAAGHDDVRAGVELLANGQRHDARRRFLAGGKLLQAGLRAGEGAPDVRRTARRLLAIASALVALTAEGALDGEDDRRSHSGSSAENHTPSSAATGLAHAATPRELSKKTA